MINHARTLLLNIDGNVKAPADYPAEEYVPSSFVALSLTPALQRIRNLLFGHVADRALYNYRLRQLLTLVHATELGDYLTALDPRITYWPLHDESLFVLSTYGATISQIAGSDSWAIKVLGNPATIKSDKELLDQWQVTVLAGNQVTVTHQLKPYETSTTTYSVTGINSSLIPLLSSTLSVSIYTGSGDLPSWQIEQYSRPLLDLSDIYASLTFANRDIDELLEIPGEPYETCKKLWQMHTGPIAYKLGAVIVALTYKLNSIYGA